MSTKKTIAIIGALEEKGRKSVDQLAGAEVRLLLFYKESEDPIATQQELAAQYPELDAVWISCPIEASWEADIIVLAIPPEEQPSVIASIKDVVTGKPVIELDNEINSVRQLITSLPYSTILSASADNIKTVIQNI